MATFREKLQDLGQGNMPGTAALKFLSDLPSEDRATLREVWPTLPRDRRERVVHALVTMIEDNLDLDFRHVFLTALEDSDAEVRLSAIEGLSEDNSTLLLGRLLTILRTDPDEDVREATATALGRFTYLAQCNKLNSNGDRLRAALIESALDGKEDEDVRRRAVESLGYYHQDGEVQQLIAGQYKQGGRHGESAVLAMGRSMDDQWQLIILHELNSERPAMRYEAAHAAGEMTLEEALPQLVKMLSDKDTEVRLAAIWALGQIGGKQASEALKGVLGSKDPAMREAAEEAMQEIAFSSDPLNIAILDEPQKS
ncbi:MAG TPA: HEAT repeat domain-containing protein [Chloroflexia bacterium]|nr:HEAT repeat domain-containing protein [Chloroflexia bacterium]